jgi:hypothetical protein
MKGGVNMWTNYYGKGNTWKGLSYESYDELLPILQKWNTSEAEVRYLTIEKLSKRMKKQNINEADFKVREFRIVRVSEVFKRVQTQPKHTWIFNHISVTTRVILKPQNTIYDEFEQKYGQRVKESETGLKFNTWSNEIWEEYRKEVIKYNPIFRFKGNLNITQR